MNRRSARSSGEDAENGIRLVPGLLPVALTPVVVSGNRLQGLKGNGIAIETLLVSLQKSSTTS
jgi:hypothetical protein